jgi:hypothetical protein
MGSKIKFMLTSVLLRSFDGGGSLVSDGGAEAGKREGKEGAKGDRGVVWR